MRRNTTSSETAFARLRTDRPSHRRGFGGLHRKTLAPFPICSRRERKHAKPKHNCGAFSYGAHPSWYAKGTEPVRCLFSSLEGFLPVADAQRRLLDFARRSVAPFSLFRRTLCSLRIPHGTPTEKGQHALSFFCWRTIDERRTLRRNTTSSETAFARLRTDRPSHRRGFGGLHRKTLAPFPICSRRERKHAKPKHNCGEFPYGAHPSWCKQKSSPFCGLYGGVGVC